MFGDLIYYSLSHHKNYRRSVLSPSVNRIKTRKFVIFRDCYKNLEMFINFGRKKIKMHFPCIFLSLFWVKNAVDNFFFKFFHINQLHHATFLNSLQTNKQIKQHNPWLHNFLNKKLFPNNSLTFVHYLRGLTLQKNFIVSQKLPLPTKKNDTRIFF